MISKPIIEADLSFIFIVLRQKQAWNGSDVYHFQFFAQFKCKNFCLGFKAQCKIKFTYSPTESEDALKFLVKMFQDS